MKRLTALFHMNPIVVKEIRSRMRGPRAFITLTLILIVMGGIMYGVLQLVLAGSRYSNVLSPQVGQILFAALVFLELFMICAITPAVTAGAISGEKEKQTYEMLMATPLSPTSILWGKLVSALSYVFLLLFAGIPLASLVFIFGGVALRDMGKALLVLLVTAISYGILGLFLSALLGRTGRATVASFILVVVLMIGPLFLAGVIGVIRDSEPPRWLLAPSPISALSSTLAPTMGIDSGGSIFYVLSGMFNMGIAPISQTSIPRPLYHYTIPFYALLSLVLYMLTTRLVQPTRRWRIRRKEILFGAASVLLLAGVIVGSFLLSAPRYEWAINPQAQPDNARDEVFAVPQPAMAPGVVAEKRVEVIPADITPTPTPTAYPEAGPNVPSAAISEDDHAAIYAAIARQLYLTDNTFGGNAPGWTSMYLVSTTDDSIGDPNIPHEEPVILPESVIAAVTDGLKDLPAEVIWIETRDGAPQDPSTGQVDNGKGVIFTFGNIHSQEDGTVKVSASLYFANMGAGGKTYILQKTDQGWTINGTTGVEWIS